MVRNLFARDGRKATANSRDCLAEAGATDDVPVEASGSLQQETAPRTDFK